jgi:transcriptional regulator with XRE-family HTH domain
MAKTSAGARIKLIRTMRGMTQKELGLALGFDEKSADVRIAQYETGTRTPKKSTIDNIADALRVNPKSLDRLNIDNYEGLIHAFFTIEDIYGIKISRINGTLCLLLDKNNKHLTLFEMFNIWQQKAEQLENGEITEAEYNEWRYNFGL